MPAGTWVVEGRRRSGSFHRESIGHCWLQRGSDWDGIAEVRRMVSGESGCDGFVVVVDDVVVDVVVVVHVEKVDDCC